MVDRSALTAEAREPRQITCVNCDGKGYTVHGYGPKYPVECAGCRGTGKQTIRRPFGA